MAQTNAKEEFLKVTKYCTVVCAEISIGSLYIGDLNNEIESPIVAKLPVGFTQEQLDKFLNTIDVNYDNGYGGQELFGMIWCENGIWFDRGEYDGSEWWNGNRYPEIPEYLSSQKDLKNESDLNALESQTYEG